MTKKMKLRGGHVVVVDDQDYSLLSSYRWRPLISKNTVYVHAWAGADHFYLHRLILSAPDGMHVDHKDRNGLNNRRSNLRLATPSQNHANRTAENTRKQKSSIYKGVYWNAERRKWQATIHVNGHTRSLGRYVDEWEAAKAYNKAAKDQWGEFALLNKKGKTRWCL